MCNIKGGKKQSTVCCREVSLACRASLRLVGLSVSGAEKTATLLSQIMMGRCAHWRFRSSSVRSAYSAPPYVIAESPWMRTIIWPRLAASLRSVCAKVR